MNRTELLEVSSRIMAAMMSNANMMLEMKDIRSHQSDPNVTDEDVTAHFAVEAATSLLKEVDSFDKEPQKGRQISLQDVLEIVFAEKEYPNGLPPETMESLKTAGFSYEETNLILHLMRMSCKSTKESISKRMIERFQGA